MPAIQPTSPSPDQSTVIAITSNHFSESPTYVSRFKTGSGNYVFEVSFAKNPPIVVRIAGYKEYETVEGAIFLSNQLRPIGVPLPKLLGKGTIEGFPYLILERLPGSDLGDHLHTLSPDRLEKIAVQVMQAQKIVSRLPSCGKYGYSIHPESAPFSKWGDVIQESLDRSRKRILHAGLFNVEVVDSVETIFSKIRPTLDAIDATPFLHDTTTKNVIVTPEGKFSGIVDVDDLCFGDPRKVIALTRVAVMVSGGNMRYIDALMQAGSFSSDSVFEFYVALFLVDFMSEHGQSFNGNEKKSDPLVRKKLTLHLKEALDKISP